MLITDWFGDFSSLNIGTRTDMASPVFSLLRLAAAAFVGAASFATVSFAQTSQPAAQDVPEVKVLRYLGNAGRVTLPELAEDLGFLAPIQLEWLGVVSGGPEHLQTLATGGIEFGAGFNGSIVKLAAAGVPIKAVIQYQGSDEKYWRGIFTLEDSDIREPRDFVGKKVGVNTLGAAFEFIVREYLKRGGLSPEEIATVTLVPLPLPNIEQALREGQIDALVFSDIFLYSAVERGGLRLVASDYDILGEFSNGSYVFTDDFIAKNPKTVEHFVGAVARAIEWGIDTPREEVVARLKKIVVERNRGEDPALQDYWVSNGLAGRHGVLKPEYFQAFLDWYVDNGELTADTVNIANVYTNAYNPFKE